MYHRLHVLGMGQLRNKPYSREYNLKSDATHKGLLKHNVTVEGLLVAHWFTFLHKRILTKPGEKNRSFPFHYLLS